MATPRTAAKRTAPKPAAKVEEAVEELVEAVEEAVIDEIFEELVEEANLAIKEEVVHKPETVLIHCIRDGATAFGHIWYMGQEVEIEKDSEVFRTTLDRDGKSWVTGLLDKPGYQNASWKIGPATMPNELINYPQNFDPHGMTYHKGEWLDLTMLRLRAEREVARGRSIPKN
jgi:hypothetical protein